MKAYGKMIALLLVLTICLGACGGNGGKAADSVSQSSAAYSSADISPEAEAETTENGFDEGAAVPGGVEALRPQDRKLITTVNVEAETRGYDEFLSWLESRVAQAGGYVEASDQYAYNERERRSDLTIRIPADKLSVFLSEVGDNCNILQKSIQEEDVTLNYVDAESYRDALLVEQERLLELLEKAENLTDIMSIEDRLTTVRYQLQNYESTLRVYDNQINYSTLHMSIQEVAELTEPEPESWGNRAWAGMVKNAQDIGRFFQELGLFLVSHLPSFGILAIIIFVILLCTAKYRRQAKERRRQQKELIRSMQEQAAPSVEAEKK